MPVPTAAIGMTRIRRKIRTIILVAAMAALAASAAIISPSYDSLVKLPLASLYFWLDVAARAVIIGVVVEEAPFVVDIFKFGRVCVSDGFWYAVRIALQHRRRIFESIGFVVLVFGLLFESIFQTLVRNVEADLRLRDEKTIAALNHETEMLRSSNLALEQEVRPRGLTGKEVSDIKAALAPFKGQSVKVQSYLGDTEGHILLYALSHALSVAGMKVDVAYWMPDLSPKMAFLLGVEVDAPIADAGLAAALQGALAATSVGARKQWYPVTGANEVTVHIGVKPFRIPGLKTSP